MELTRDATIDARPDEVWRLLVDDDERAAWLADDGADRPLRIDHARPGESISWTWWDECGEASHVSITLAPTEAGGTALRVVERVGRDTPTAQASASAAWGRRLVGIELLLVLGHAHV